MDAKISHCHECGSNDVVTDFSAGDIICRSCGIILGERIIDDTPEWRSFANDDRNNNNEKSRIGDGYEIRFEGLNTLSTFLVHPKDACNEESIQKNPRRPNINNELRKAKRIQQIIDRMTDVSTQLNLPPSIMDRAVEIYALIEKKEMNIRGPEKESIPIAILVIACRQIGTSRSLKEFEASSGISKTRIGKSFLHLNKVLELQLNQATTEEYVGRFCSRLGLSSTTQAIAYNVAKNAQAMGLSTGKSPVALAASVIYLVAAYTDAKRSLEEISLVSMIEQKNVKVVSKELNKSRIGLFKGIVLSK